MQQKGFSLIEIMIVVVIIGILSVIALPAYQRYVEKTHRTNAARALYETASFMERYYTSNGRYVDSTNNPPALPTTQVPESGDAAYNLTVTATTSGYTLSAAPTGVMIDDHCGKMGLTNTGIKTVGTGAKVSECWP